MSIDASVLPFESIRSLLANLPGPDRPAVEAVRGRDKVLTKPAGSLGRMEDLAEWLAAWQGRATPAVTRPLVAVFAGNHGVTAKGVSAFPAAVTQQMVENFAAGGAAINQICIAYDLGLKVYDLALDHPTGDITETAALEEKDCVATMAYGMEAVSGGIDLLCIGEMGIGNTTVASAIYYALYGGEAADWIGRGTGVDDEGLRANGPRWMRRSPCTGIISMIRWKCCAVLAGVKSRPWPAPFSPDACRRFPLLSTASSPRRRRRSCTPPIRRPLTIACCRTSRRSMHMPPCWNVWVKNPCSISACVLARARVRRSRPVLSRPRLRCIPAWPRSVRPV